MEVTLKSISAGGIAEALSKVETYRYLNQPEEAESICQDILAIEPHNQAALRQLALSITDQFTGSTEDRFGESEGVFQRLADPYERQYYAGLLRERWAKGQLRAGRPPHTLRPAVETALRYFAEAEKIRPAGNDDAILRWNRCVRLLQGLTGPDSGPEQPGFEHGDSPPV